MDINNEFDTGIELNHTYVNEGQIRFRIWSLQV